MAPETLTNRIRIVLLHDHGLFRSSLARLLATEPDFEVAHECDTPEEALETLRAIPVDLVLLDFDFSSERRTDFLSTARETGYRGKFLVVADKPDAHTAALALRQGAAGIFLKSEAPDRLMRAIRLVSSGEGWVDPSVIQMLADQLIHQCLQTLDQGAPFLEDRERNVLLGILGGLTNRRIGEKLGLSESAVKNVVQRLFGKAGVKKRSQLVRVALEGSLGAAQQMVRRRTHSVPETHADRHPSTVPNG